MTGVLVIISIAVWAMDVAGAITALIIAATKFNSKKSTLK